MNGALKASAMLVVNQNEVRVDIKVHDGQLFYRVAEGTSLSDWKPLEK